ncbi:MAG: L-glyceraldehyde 3-phosphate reductase [Bacteroidetes bacterium]|nr:L-glyceraldehyde 3-phosphate reductase [Bacteroidota bacterium]
MNYLANSERYSGMTYRRCGNSGIKLPVITLGLWHNFGGVDLFEDFRAIARLAFDSGITHFDLANNYGPPYGSAEENFGKILSLDLKPYRDELLISTKAGFDMWPGPYGEWGSRKYLLASLDQSLKRMGLEYVDIFYSHRYDPDTPLEETMGALDQAVRQGKALYAGISNYTPEETQNAINLLKQLGTPCLIHQPKYNLLYRDIEQGLLNVLEKNGTGCIVYSPLAQGMLTNKYIGNIPDDSRAARASGFLQKSEITEEVIEKVIKLNWLAQDRGQSLAQMSLAWCLRDERVTSVVIGARSLSQMDDNLHTMRKLSFENDELTEIENILNV